MKLEIDETKVNSMNEEELKEHLALVENSLKILDGHAREVRRRVFEMVREGCYAKFVNAKEGMKVKVTYKPSYHTAKDKDSVKIGYFVNFGKEPRSGYYNFDLYRLFCNLHRVRKDGSEGQTFRLHPLRFYQIHRAMRVEELKLGQRVRIKDLEMGGGTHFAKVDSFTPDMFNGETLVVVEVLGELKVVHPKALIPLKNEKAK